jgi:serine/threonine protein kinase
MLPLDEVGIAALLRSRDEFKEIEVIGKGSSGLVQLCVDELTQEKVAVKQVGDIDNLRSQQTFLREIMLCVNLQSPLVVKILGYCLPGLPDSDGLPGLIITEYMRHGTLQDYLDRQFQGEPHPSFGPTEWTKAIFGIAVGMAQIHSHGAIHRDLKPDNIFLDENFEIRIADFGFSRFTESRLKLTMAVGTPLFMAPELYSEVPGVVYTNSVDVYSFGVLLYQLFSPEIDMDDDIPMRSPQQLLLRIAGGVRLKRVDGIPDPLWNLITDCWSSAPTKRPTFATIVERMKADSAISITGTDLQRYKEYQMRLEGIIPVTKADPVPKEPDGASAETSGPAKAPTVSGLAKAGDQRWAHLQKHGPAPGSQCGPFAFSRKNSPSG